MCGGLKSDILFWESTNHVVIVRVFRFDLYLTDISIILHSYFIPLNLIWLILQIGVKIELIQYSKQFPKRIYAVELAPAAIANAIMN